MTTANGGERLIEAVKKRDILYISTAKSYKLQRHQSDRKGMARICHRAWCDRWEWRL